MPAGAAARVAGVAMLSFVPATREAFPSLQPPPEAAYLSNTAVDPSFRRQAHLQSAKGFLLSDKGGVPQQAATARSGVQGLGFGPYLSNTAVDQAFCR